jgi:hypothetical protein
VVVSGWEVVFSGAGYEANVVAAVLESHGLAVQVFDDSAYGSLMESRVFVRMADAERARALIETESLGSDAVTPPIPPHQGEDVGLKSDPEGD